MKVLFLHPNMPGQFKHIAKLLGEDKDNQVLFLTKPRPGVSIPGVTKIEYNVEAVFSKNIHRYLLGYHEGMFNGQEVWRVCEKLKKVGFTPDVISTHSGWGDGLFLKDIYPNSPILSYKEFYYNSNSREVTFDPNEVLTDDDKARLRIKNSINLSTMLSCDWAISPTFWQFQQYPEIFYPKMTVLHEGIDTDICRPNPDISVTLASGKVLNKSHEIVTYIARNFEPYRGFPTFMRAAEIILKRRPNCEIIIAGNDGVSYGRAHPSGKTYKQVMLEEVKLDMNRVHFLGPIPYNVYTYLLQLSGAHIYLTMPFTLSWSMMEAMSSGCLMICSNTEPIREIMTDRKDGLLVDFFSPEDVANKVDEVFAHKNRMQEIRENARKKIVEEYSLHKLLPLHKSLLEDMAAKKIPPPTAQTIKKMHKHFGHGFVK